MKNLGFYVTTYCISQIDNDRLIRCIESVRLIYPNNNIVIIDDNSPYQIELKIDDNMKIVKSEVNQIGELLPYYHNSKYDTFDQYLTIHDSMVFKKEIPDKYFEYDFVPLWHFDTNMKCKYIIGSAFKSICKQIKNGKIIYKIYNNPNCKPCCDCGLEIYDTKTKQPIKLLDKPIDTENNKIFYNWVGCFGLSAIVKNTYIKSIITKYQLDQCWNIFNNRINRMCGERLFGIIALLENQNSIQSINGNIMDHLNKFNYDGDTIIPITAILELYKNYDSCLIKTWVGR